MLLPILAALLMFVDAPVAATTPAPAPEAAAPLAAPAVDPVIARIDELMTPWKDKAGDPLRGRLGLTYSTKLAKDGEVVFWKTTSESMACGVAPSGEMRCGTNASAECALGIAFDKTGKVKTWKVQGAPDACQKFIPMLAKP